MSAARATYPLMPEEASARTKAGHTFGADHPGGLSSAARWTCLTCGDAVLMANGVVYGGATERTCAESDAYWNGTS